MVRFIESFGGMYGLPPTRLIETVVGGPPPFKEHPIGLVHLVLAYGYGVCREMVGSIESGFLAEFVVKVVVV